MFGAIGLTGIIAADTLRLVFMGKRGEADEKVVPPRNLSASNDVVMSGRRA
jgi:hypothetical protein